MKERTAILFIIAVFAIYIVGLGIILYHPYLSDIPTNSDYCEGFCKLNHLEFDRYVGYGKCICKECESLPILDKDVKSCKEIEFNLEIE